MLQPARMAATRKLDRCVWDRPKVSGAVCNLNAANDCASTRVRTHWFAPRRMSHGSHTSGDMSDIFWLSDAQMTRLEPYFPKSHGKPCVDDRRVPGGIILIDCNGLRWRDAPKEYGPQKTLYDRWKRWHDRGVFTGTMAGLAAERSEEKTAMSDAA